MHTTPPTRPETSIRRIFSALKPVSTPLEVVPNKRLSWEIKDIPQLYIVERGEISVIRVSDGLLIGTSYDQNIFGMSEAIQPMRSHYLRSEKSGIIFRVDASIGFDVIRTQNLWEDVSIVLSYYNGYLFYRDALVVQQRIYKIVRAYILEMAELSAESRLTVPILEYIQKRTHLSRSSILNAVQILTNGGYIEVKRGGYLLKAGKIPRDY